MVKRLTFLLPKHIYIKIRHAGKRRGKEKIMT